MTLSPQAQQYAEFLGSVGALAAIPGLELPVVREICESFHRATAEPEDVTYAEVDANGVPALWAIPAGAAPDHALLHLHFGGSVVASMHTDRKAAGHIAKATGVRSLVIDFRRAPEHPHPAQIEDARTAFDWLVAQGFAPRKIAATGHSIGGTLAVLLALGLHADDHDLPGAVLSISPWCDPTLSDPAITTNAATDRMLNRPLLEMFRAAWIGQTGIDLADPGINLLTADLAPLPPTYLAYGTYELLSGDGDLFGQRLNAAGVDAQIHPLTGGQHSFILGAGRVPEVDAAITGMAGWLRKTLSL
ncbi:MAG: alpha/beta hydrolase fold domain-containing protein [Actinobacteria bacterium]|nr:alpha/beta hydrolase fold domain-containing protein [Actinomycetota bacterium]